MPQEQRMMNHFVINEASVAFIVYLRLIVNII